MFTFIFINFLAAMIAYLAYLVKYKKHYNLVAGCSDEPKNELGDSKKEVVIIADTLFFFSACLLVFSIINLFKDCFRLIHEDLEGLFIILASAALAIVYLIIRKY